MCIHLVWGGIRKVRVPHTRRWRPIAWLVPALALRIPLNTVRPLPKGQRRANKLASKSTASVNPPKLGSYANVVLIKLLGGLNAKLIRVGVTNICGQVVA